jgi:hypothetical protein
MSISFRKAVLVALCLISPVLFGLGHSAAETTTRSLGNRPQSLKRPYLKKAETRGSFTIWIVDGTYIRTTLDEEFTNFGQHYRFRFVPKNELWIDWEASEDEQAYFVAHLLIEERLMAQGVSYDSALEAADRQELLERERSDDRRKVLQKDGLPDPAKVHLELWEQIQSNVTVWIVDGRLVRSAFDVDFTEGGHGFVYDFVPRNEVWIDNDLQKTERPFILLHELHERNLMTKGWTYSDAHAEASAVESYYRHHPDRLPLKLASEGW